jgi:hypothetical protein
VRFANTAGTGEGADKILQMASRDKMMNKSQVGLGCISDNRIGNLLFLSLKTGGTKSSRAGNTCFSFAQVLPGRGRFGLIL